MRGVHYTRNDTGKDHTGVVAQEIQKIAPEVVLTSSDEMGTLSVDYGNITGYLIEAIKELSAKVKELEGK
jgi:tRNA A37 threonylcarbamoyladenosine dehydratase